MEDHETGLPVKGENSDPPLSSRGRLAFRVLGYVFLALGAIGAALPVMPTTIFLIGAAWAFGRSSPKLEAWLLDHPRFGPSLRAWRMHGAMSRRAKLYACLGKTVGFACFLFFAQPPLWLAAAVFAIMVTVALWIVRRPSPPMDDNAIAG